jgi:hypothetical protein
MAQSCGREKGLEKMMPRRQWQKLESVGWIRRRRVRGTSRREGRQLEQLLHPGGPSNEVIPKTSVLDSQGGFERRHWT